MYGLRLQTRGLETCPLSLSSKPKVQLKKSQLLGQNQLFNNICLHHSLYSFYIYYIIWFIQYFFINVVDYMLNKHIVKFHSKFPYFNSNFRHFCLNPSEIEIFSKFPSKFPSKSPSKFPHKPKFSSLPLMLILLIN